MNQDRLKQMAADAAMAEVEPGMIVGIGTGSTANRFIDALAGFKNKIEGTVASSESSAKLLHSHGIRVLSLDEAGRLPLYVDGADEATQKLSLIKGGGGALTREKIVAAASDRFVCIVDGTKMVEKLGAFPLPVEIIPLARVYIEQQLSALGGRPELRTNFITDNGNLILDTHQLDIADPVVMESEINNIAGVVTNGLFARRPADLLLIGTDSGLNTLHRTR